MPSSIYIMVIPVLVSPFIIAWWIGAPPRYFGSNDAWTNEEVKVLEGYIGEATTVKPGTITKILKDAY